ncbi:MAG: hypothetical protein MI861_28475, partial [Pirellulales bacterium]|nr:hypothetical protein [Pirellulales bacterium]
KDASAEETVERLKFALQAELPIDAIGDAQQIQRSLRNPQTARSVARRWLMQITQGGLAQVDRDAQQQLIDEVAQCFESQKNLDEVLAAWIGGNSSLTAPFYAAVSVGGSNQMVRRLASLTMNADLRCVQCHDAFIESSGRQEDYWAFAAFLRQNLKRESGVWSVAAQADRSQTVFYDLLDGRRKVAEPGIAAGWLPQSPPVQTIGDWSEALTGSPELARGVVNSLWKLVYGQALQGRVIDTITAPHHESLDQLEQRLAQDLVDSGFDVGRTLALIVASPVASRSVPEALRPENAPVAPRDAIFAAMESVNAFAAALPPRNHLSLDHRVRLAKSRVGADLDRINRAPILAQPDGTPSTDNPKPLGSNGLPPGDDFPSRADSLPVQWLASI